MSHRTAFTLALLLGLLLPAVAAAAPATLASPASISFGPCAPGAVYDPACDVDHDGDVDVLDVQLAAGHWNQSGVWVSDNGHDHFGQTWTGSNNPLKLTGSFGAPDFAPLVLSNPASSGLRITTAGNNGVEVVTAGNNGMYVNAASNDGYAVFSAGDDGVIVTSAGSPSTSTASSLKNGFEVAGAQGHGLYVGRADSNGVNVNSAGGDGVVVTSAGDDGVYVNSAGSPSASTTSSQKNGFEVAGAQGHGLYVGRADFHGVRVNSAGNAGLYVLETDGDGVYVGSAADDGLYVGSAADDGVEVTGADFAGVFNGFLSVSAGCVGCRQANFAINVGNQTLEPGDVVSIQGVVYTDFDTGPVLWQVMPAQPGTTVVGVVTGRAEVDIQDEHRPDETGKRLVPRAGAAQPDEYVTIVYSGPAQVKIASNEAAITTGMRVTAATDGTVRPLLTRTVEGMVVAEGAPVLGVALADATGDLVWVLVNPQ